MTAKEFTRIWNSLLLSIKKSVKKGDVLPIKIMSLDAEQEIMEKIQFVIERVNKDNEFQQSVYEGTGRRLLLYSNIDGSQLNVLAQEIES